MANHSDEGFHWLEIDFSDVLFLLRKHLRLLIAAPIAGFVLALVVTLLIRPQFTSDALIYLRPNFDKDMQVERVGSKLEDDDSLRSIERSMIADTVILRMVDRLGLRDDEDFLGRGALDDGPLSDAKLLKTIRDRYRSELVPTTRLVELEVDDYSAERATLIANTLIDEYLVHLRNDRSAKEVELRTALTAQVEKSLAATLALESKLQIFRSDHPDEFVEQDSEIFHDRILQQGAALNEANSEMARLAGTVQALQVIDPQEDPYRVFQILSNRNSEYLSNLLSMLTAAKTELAGVKRRSTERAPDYRAAVSRLEQVESTMRDYAMEMKNGVESEYRAAVEKVSKLNDTLVGLQGEFVGFKSTSAEFRGMKGEIDRHWNTFANLQQSIMDLDLQPETTPNFVTVVSEPVVPDKKAKPSRVLWCAAGMILGGLVALGLIFISNRRGLPFTSPAQAAEGLGLSALAALEIPCVGSVAEQMAVIDRSPQLLNILIAMRDTKVAHVTSIGGQPQFRLLPEMIGRLYGKHGRETLWIVFGYQSEKVVQSEPTDAPRLSRLELSAEQLLNCDQFRSGLDQLLEKFDRIIVDTTQLSEAEAKLAVAQLVQHTLLLVDGQSVPRSDYEQAVKQLQAIEASELSLIYLTSASGRSTESNPSAEPHHQGARTTTKDEPQAAAKVPGSVRP